MLVELAAVDEGGESDHRGADAAVGERQGRVFDVGAVATGRAVVLGADAVEPHHRQHQRAAGVDEGLVGAGEGVAEGLGRGHVGGDRALHLAGRHQLVLEGEVDDAVGVGGRLLEAVEIVEVAAPHLGAGRLDLGGRLVGAGEPDDFVARLEQIGGDGAADVAGRAGDEYAHGKPPEDRSTPGPLP